MNFHNFGIRNGTEFQGFGMNIRKDILFRKIGIRSGILFSKNWYKERVCF